MGLIDGVLGSVGGLVSGLLGGRSGAGAPAPASPEPASLSHRDTDAFEETPPPQRESDPARLAHKGGGGAKLGVQGGDE